MTTVKRALEDMFHAETYSKDLIESAVSEALKSGHLTALDLKCLILVRVDKRMRDSSKAMIYAR